MMQPQTSLLKNLLHPAPLCIEPNFTHESRLNTAIMSPFGYYTTSDMVVDEFADQIKGRVFLITGPSDKSLGGYAATSIAKKSPAHIILVSRNKAKVDPVLKDIASIDASIKTSFFQCDLADLNSVRNAAGEINADASIGHIDVVLNSAGVMYISEYTLDRYGRELTLSACHIGHFLLTNLIMPKILAAGKGARIVSVTSRGHTIGPFRFDDWNFSGGKAYDGWSAYGQAKTANILFAVELADRLADHGITAVSVHPGSILGTGLTTHMNLEEDLKNLDPTTVRNTGKHFVSDGPPKNISEGAAAMLAAMLDPFFDRHSGALSQDCQVACAHAYASDKGNARKLWHLSEEWVGQKFDP